MFTVLTRIRKSLSAVVTAPVAALAALALAACTPSAGPGPTVSNDAAVQVALLVPSGSGQASDELLARSLEQAARLAIADLQGVRIDLRVYGTGGSPANAAAQAVAAVNNGAKVILGPVFAQEANAAGVAVAPMGVNVLSFSNNTDVAGGNVFVLGPTFANTARRLAGFAVQRGRANILIVKDQTPAGEIGAAAIRSGVAGAGGVVAGEASYEFSQNGVVQAAPAIVAQVRSTGASAVFLTADTAGALPLITQMLADNGLGGGTTQFLGLTRWDIPAATLALPGVQGGWFALPDPALYAQFEARYSGAYGEPPHPIAGLAYDGIAAVGALLRQGKGDALSAAALTQGAGFVGVSGIFRLNADGSNTRGLAVAQISNQTLTIIDAAPRSFGGAGF